MKKEDLQIKKDLKNQRGSEILQVILVAGILLVLIVTLFYPQMQELFENIMDTISNWFTTVGSDVFKA